MSERIDEILSAFDDDETGSEFEQDSEQPEAEETVDAAETPSAAARESEELSEQPEQDEDEEPDEDEQDEQPDEEAKEGEEGEEEESGEEEQEAPEPISFTTDDQEILNYLARFQGDPVAALKNLRHLEKILGQQGQDKAVLNRRVAELERELAQATSLASAATFLNPEQQQWVESAVGSGTPRVYVQQAVQAGEFDLARAVCEEWAVDSPYDAARVAAQVDQAQAAATWQTQQQAAQERTVDHNALMGVLVEHFPEMPNYEEKMLTTLQALGESHPLVADARSTDPELAARGIIGIYEIARASSATVNATREQVKTEKRKAADDAKQAAVVSSGQATPAKGQTPRKQRVAPGLTMEQLDEAWDTK